MTRSGPMPDAYHDPRLESLMFWLDDSATWDTVKEAIKYSNLRVRQALREQTQDTERIER